MKTRYKKTAHFIIFLYFLSVFTLFAFYSPNANFVVAQPENTSTTQLPPTSTTMSEPTATTMSEPSSNSNVIKLTNPFSKGDNLYQFIQAVVSDILLPIGGVLAVIAIIYSGFKLVTAQGNETKLEEAKRAFLYTAIGVAILLGSWAIAQVIENTVKQVTG